MKKNNKNLTIVINVYNEEKNLPSILDQLLNQLPDYNLIIINDGSLDKTLEILEEYKPLFIKKEIPYNIYTLSHIGLREARENGFNKATTEYVLVLDADLIIPKNLIELCQQKINTSNNIAAFGFPIITNPINLISSIHNLLGRLLIKRRQKNKEISWIQGGAALYKKDIINLIGGLPKGNIGEDVEISWKLKEEGYSLSLINEAVILHKDFDSLKKIWLSAEKVGHRSYHIYKKYPHKFNFDFWVKFIPLTLLLFLGALILISLLLNNYLYFLIGLILALGYLLILPWNALKIKGLLRYKLLIGFIFAIDNLAWSYGFLKQWI